MVVQVENHIVEVLMIHKFARLFDQRRPGHDERQGEDEGQEHDQRSQEGAKRGVEEIQEGE